MPTPDHNLARFIRPPRVYSPPHFPSTTGQWNNSSIIAVRLTTCFSRETKI